LRTRLKPAKSKKYRFRARESYLPWLTKVLLNQTVYKRLNLSFSYQLPIPAVGVLCNY